MKKGILIVGNENDAKMKYLEEQLEGYLERMEYPLDDERFWAEETEPKVLQFRKNGQLRRLSTDWIVYLEKEMRKIWIYFERRDRLMFYMKMDDAWQQLGENFCQCHKSFIINMDKVEEMRDTCFIMNNGAVVPIGQRRRHDVAQKYETYREQKNIEKQRFFESFSCFGI
ncbi:MAG: LytTR family transcriptional regulator [Firmicutes bacterium]|nr:LytTR family transcriptional regulator [Bacillota bacterium]